MRIHSVLTVFMWTTALAATWAVAQDGARTESHDATSHDLTAVITGISVGGAGDNVTVEVTFSKLVHAEVTTVEHPDRLVFDFAGCVLAHAGQRLTVNRGAVLAVRAAAFSAAPPVARIVIDLRKTVAHTETYDGNKLVVMITAGSGAGGVATAAGVNRPDAGRTVADRTVREKSFAPSDKQVLAPKIERGSSAVEPKAADSALSIAVARPSPVIAVPASGQFRAYALLDRARTLSISDLGTLEAKAQAGDAESETILALAYHAGVLLKLDDGEALRLLQKAANGGFVAAEEALGIFAQMGFGKPADKGEAVAWYTKAAQQGSTDAATNLALMYSTGDGIPKDSSKAATWFRSAAEAGDATAQLNLGMLYRRGDALPRDDGQAALWLTKAAEQGLVPAELELARWDMRTDQGRNVDAAITWFKKAAEQGDATAQATLGDIFSDQKLGRLDYGQAVSWYQKAADQGNREAQFGLGVRYLFGEGVPQDFEEARRWLTPAADRGHRYAQFFLAKMLEEGQGGPADAGAALKYYESSASSGIPEAQYRLGLLLASSGKDASLSSAYKWLVLAQDSVKESGARAQELRKSLTPAQIAEAEREIDAWRSSHANSNSGH